MKTAVKKTKRGIKAALFVSLFLYVFAMFCPTVAVGRNVTKQAKAEGQLNYDTSYVMDDLSGMTIDGKKFQKTDYGFDVKQETQVVTLAEYCYSYDPTRRENYGLYVYVYNPKAIDFKDSPMNRITVCAGEDDRWKKYELDELSVCKDQDYEGMFYKYKLRLTESERTEILNRVKSTERVYEVSEIELLTNGTMNGTSYKVGSEYVYSGYSKGYGANVGASSTLTSMRHNFETLSLEVKATTYRPSGTNGKNEYTQDSLHSVYFSVPKKTITKYGEMTAVHATWLNAVLKPMLVTGNEDAYEAILPYLGQTLTGHNKSLSYFYLGGVTQYVNSADVDWRYGYGYNVAPKGNFQTCTQTKYGKDISTLYAMYFSGGETDSADSYTVNPSEITESLKAGATTYGGELVNGKYASCMFENVDEEFTDVNIKANENYKLTSEKISQSWWQKWFGTSTTQTTTFDGITAIYAVQASDLTGTEKAISERLYISASDVADFKTYYEEKTGENVVYLFRYQTSDYIAQEATLFKSYTSLGVLDFKKVDTNAYFFQETVNLDFDIIDVTFDDGKKSTVMAVVSSPIDVIPEATNPVKTQSDKKWSMPWWGYAIIALVALWLLGKIVPPIWTALKFVLKVVTVPVWGPIRLIKKLKGEYDDD